MTNLADQDRSPVATYRSRANRARGVVWFVFVVALGVACALRWSLIDQAVQQITWEASAIADARKADASRSLEAIVSARSAVLYGTETGPAVDNHRRLARGLAFEQDALGGEFVRKDFAGQTRRRLETNFFIVGLVQAIIVLVFPTMFQIRATQGLKHIEKAAAGKHSATFWNTIWTRRHKQFLDDEGEKVLFWRRLGFAVLISLSSMYLLSPAGLEASMVGEYASIQAPPGSASYPFWFNAFSQASPLVLGLSGYLLYSLMVFTKRALALDISNRLFVSLWNRGIIVVIVSLALTGVDEGSNFSRALVFIAGVFPQTGIQAITSVAKSGADQLKRQEARGFADLPEIGFKMESALLELNVTNSSELARTDLRWLIGASGVGPRVILRATDRALLLDQLGTDLVAKLAALPAATASELLLFADGADAYQGRWAAQGLRVARELAPEIDDAAKIMRRLQICTVLEVQDLGVQLQELRGNHNVKFIIDNKVSFADL